MVPGLLIIWFNKIVVPKFASVDTSNKYCVAPATAPQFALNWVQVKLDAGVAVGAIGEVVLILITPELPLVEQPLVERTR